MKKSFIVLIFLVFIISGCRKNEKQQEVQQEVQQKMPLEEQQDAAVLEPNIKLDVFTDFICKQKEVLLRKLEFVYEMLPMEISKLEKGYYSDDKTASNCDERLQNIECQGEAFPKYVMEDSKSNGEIPLNNVSDEVKKSIDDINNALLNRKLYQCFSLEDYNNHYDMSWPAVLEKEIIYDFNKDKKLEVLKIRCIFGTRDEETSILEPKETVFEITLGDKKVIVKPNPECWDEYFEVGICDVDLEDNYVEFYTTQFEDCYGSSLLFRLNGKCLEEAVGTGYEEIVGVSGDGKIFIWNGSFRNTYFEDESYEDFLLWYLDYKTGNFISSNHMIGKIYHAFYDDILFRQLEYVPWGPPINITLDLPGAFYEPEFGELLTVLDKDDGAQAIKVRTQDGKEGWIGGHHMVWN